MPLGSRRNGHLDASLAIYVIVAAAVKCCLAVDQGEFGEEGG